MAPREDAFVHITQIIQSYFTGLYNADTHLLRSVFHPSAMLQAPGLRLTRDKWLTRVGSRPIPREQSSDDNFRMLALEVTGTMAMAKVFCPLFQYQYVDYLILLKEEERWLIVNKTYADSAAPAHKENGQCPTLISK